MSSSSESSRRPGIQQPTEPPERRKSSKYEIYDHTTKPFGEGYRKSVLFKEQEYGQEGQPEESKECEESAVDTDSVEERSAMGCSESRTEVAVTDEAVKGSFNPKEDKATELKNDAETLKTQGSSEVIIVDEESKGVGDNTFKGEEKADQDTIYNTEIRNINNVNGYSTLAIYSEVKKETKKINQNSIKTPREQLMQQIRDRKVDKENNGLSSALLKAENVNKDVKNENKVENTAIYVKTQDEKLVNTTVTSSPVSFIEEEYSYEPEKKESTSKLVVRSRSLLNLDQNQFNYNSTMTCTLKRPNTLKMTTKPDGTIRYGLRNGSSEPDLLDNNDSDESPAETSELKTNYVNSIKNAFDAAIESKNRETCKRADAFDGLKQYFHDNKHGLQELLINNNVVVIEPFRPDQATSPGDKSDIGSPRTCRITGATIKSPVNEHRNQSHSSNTLPRRHTKTLPNTRQGFYHPIKVNKELIDAELPDPDKVKTARELFQKVAKSNSVPTFSAEKTGCKPMCNSISSKMRITPEVKVIHRGKQTSDKKRVGLEGLREDSKRCAIQRRWTDSGSLSSGVSSDFSCDQDWDLHQYNEGSHGGSNQDILEEYNSDDDVEYIYPYDDIERHPVSLEVLQKIRACGTTVTYYGGKILSRSHGQLRSPMTMSIMDEIRQNSGACEGRKKTITDADDSYLGVKFRLVKSNSCGSRLEIAGTEEEFNTKLISPRHENFRGKCIAEETAEVNEDDTVVGSPEVTTEKPMSINECVDEYNHALSNEEEEDKTEADRYVTNGDITSIISPQVMTWAELKLKEAQKQWHCTPEAVRLPPQDMEFETFEVLEESPHKQEKTETGRG